MKIRELLVHLNDTAGATCDAEASSKARRAIDLTREFIEIFERSNGQRIAGSDRMQLSQHLWKAHVDSRACNECPYFDILSPWRSLLPSTSLWLAWVERERKRADRPALWSAFKTLSTYLSLQGEGLRPGTEFALVDSSGRKQLKDGNNRVRLLAAMGREELEVKVKCA